MAKMIACPIKNNTHRWLTISAAITIVIVVSVIFGVAGLLLNTLVTLQPVLFITTGFIVYAVSTAAGVYFIAKYAHVSHKKLFFVCFGVPIVLLSMIQIVAQLISPLPKVIAPTDMRYWSLPTGSHIAYKRIGAQGQHKGEPIIFLHGGPGVSDLKNNSKYFGQLATMGHDVYVYDQLGAGFSSRLQDPRGYSVTRDAADLEAIRQIISAEQIIIISHSYGAGIAAQYIVQYPKRVAKLVLSSPGSIASGVDAGSGESIQKRLNSDERLDLYTHLFEPRALFTITDKSTGSICRK